MIIHGPKYINMCIQGNMFEKIGRVGRFFCCFFFYIFFQNYTINIISNIFGLSTIIHIKFYHF